VDSLTKDIKRKAINGFSICGAAQKFLTIISILRISTSMIDYYKILEVEPNATYAEIKKSYYRLAYKYHPDRSDYNRSEELFSKISEAYHVLSDPQKKREYDYKRRNGTTEVARYQPPAQEKNKFNFTNPGILKKKVREEKGTVKIMEESPFLQLTRPLVWIIALFSSIILLDIVLPPRIEKVVIANQLSVEDNSVIVLTDQGEKLEIQSEHGFWIPENVEVELFYTLLFSRFYKVELSEWPWTVMVRDINYFSILFVSAILLSLCLSSILRKYHPKKELRLGILIILFGIGLLLLVLY
jgi:curved DNA-binding protein CbpA